jgi:hypothetical protein
LQKACRERIKARWTDEQKLANRRRLYNSWLRRNYGIGIGDYDSMYESQGGKCKICFLDKPYGRGGFHVDHCHASGVIRGLLCAKCNMMLGMANDDTQLLSRAIDYIKTAGGKKY